MRVTPLAIPEVLHIEPRVFGDARGFFVEAYHARRYAEHGIEAPFVQDNHSRSSRGVLRGLHYQRQNPQGKLVRVGRGEIFDVAVDIRRESPWFGQWIGITLTEQDQNQLYIPAGFAHGFLTLSEQADVIYKCTDFYVPTDDYGIAWNDRTIGIDWPAVDGIQLSDKDRGHPFLSDVTTLPEY